MNKLAGHTKKRVAVVEDDKNLRYSIGLALRSCGYDVGLFDSCDEFFRENGYDLVLTSNNTFGTSCFKMRDELKRKKIEVPMIVMCAYGSCDIMAKSDFFRELDYIEKPFVTDELIRKISFVLNERCTHYL